MCHADSNAALDVMARRMMHHPTEASHYMRAYFTCVATYQHHNLVYSMATAHSVGMESVIHMLHQKKEEVMKET